MSFVSYAQNFEDVMLWRALKNIKQGFYIDVGANDPIEDSVTKAFYEKGWRGINIEPLPLHYLALESDRPGDINLQCAVGDSGGELVLWDFGVRGWATATNEVATELVKKGYKESAITVSVRTLAEICDQYANRDIHFLKIDVEGFEKFVINSMNFSLHRPWIVLVEAMKPNSQEEAHQDWEKILASADYHFAYADGVNRFYVADERRELLIELRYPPNVFDQFIRYQEVRFSGLLRESDEIVRANETRYADAEARVVRWHEIANNLRQESERRLAELNEHKLFSKTRYVELQSKNKALEDELRSVLEVNHNHWLLAESRGQELEKILGSRSWRFTKSLRYGLFLLRNYSEKLGFLTALMGKYFDQILRNIAKVIYEHPKVKRQIERIFFHFPALQNALSIRLKGCQESSEMSASAAEIYYELKASLRRS